MTLDQLAAACATFREKVNLRPGEGSTIVHWDAVPTSHMVR